MNKPKPKRPQHRALKKTASKVYPRKPHPDGFAGVNPKLAALLRKHFTEKGRTERIARADRALRKALEIGATYKHVDIDTIKKIAEDPDLEYI